MPKNLTCRCWGEDQLRRPVQERAEYPATRSGSRSDRTRIASDGLVCVSARCRMRFLVGESWRRQLKSAGLNLAGHSVAGSYLYEVGAPFA
jgi:hypothetical protein